MTAKCVGGFLNATLPECYALGKITSRCSDLHIHPQYLLNLNFYFIYTFSYKLYFIGFSHVKYIQYKLHRLPKIHLSGV